jgi:hypothetical protein
MNKRQPNNKTPPKLRAKEVRDPYYTPKSCKHQRFAAKSFINGILFERTFIYELISSNDYDS